MIAMTIESRMINIDPKEFDELTAENERLKAFIDHTWRRVIAYPFPQICKHLVASNMLSDMEELGFDVTQEVARAVVQADDEAALEHPKLGWI
jgi:hypothetical protein